MSKFVNLEKEYYRPVLVSGEPVGICLNFNIISTTGGLYQIDIVDCNFQTVVENISGVSEVLVDLNTTGTVVATLQYFIEQEAFETLEAGVYYFVLYDPFSDKVLVISNEFYVNNRQASLDLRTIQVKFRNTAPIFNYRYDLKPNFYNQFRIYGSVSQPTPGQDSIGYDLTSGNYLPVRSTIEESVRIIFNWHDREAHRAAMTMTAHSDLRINGEAYRKQASQNYQVDWQEEQTQLLSDAEIRLNTLDYGTTHRLR